MSWSFFHHISFLCYALFLSLSLPPWCSSSLCHCCMVTQTLQRCYIWMIGYIRWVTHTDRTLSISEKFFSTRSSTKTLHRHTLAGHNLWKTLAELAIQTVSFRDWRIKRGLCSDSALYLRSWLHKQADFSGVPFTLPWPLLHNKRVHTQQICQSTAPQRGKVFLHSLALSVHLSVFLPSAQFLSLVFKF